MPSIRICRSSSFQSTTKHAPWYHEEMHGAFVLQTPEQLALRDIGHVARNPPVRSTRQKRPERRADRISAIASRMLALPYRTAEGDSACNFPMTRGTISSA